MTIGNVVDHLIKLEKSLNLLYLYFGELFPDDSSFWNQLAEEENNHASILDNYKKYLPIEFQKMDKKPLIQTEEDIRKNLKDFKNFPPTIEAALNFSYLIENNAGEIHYQSLLMQNSSAETIRVFQILNFADKDHAKRIKDYLLRKGSNWNPV